ncbi:MAG: endolytic transglycosylase MltG [Nannocystaceae bacterium]
MDSVAERRWYRPRRSRRPQQLAFLIVSATLLVGMLSAWHGYTTLAGYPERPGIGSDTKVTVEIPRGASFQRVLDLLVASNVIAEDDATMFKLFVLHRGAGSRMTAGKHVMWAGMTPQQRLEELTTRRQAAQLTITIPEGKNMIEVASILGDAGIGERGANEAAMRDAGLLAELEIPGPSAEGYLFPDTYRFSSDVTVRQVIRRLVRRHRQVYGDLSRRYREAERRLGRGLGWEPHQVVTLASIVEKETAAKHERPLIAGVFLNRLRFSSFKPKYLATDPTIVYGCTVPVHKSIACAKFEGRIRRIQLRDPDNPYNTYTHTGLPPGPISNPGQAALESVFAPKKSRFLYFVSRNDGSHKFSRSRAEHEAAVDRYQRRGAVGDGTP